MMPNAEDGENRVKPNRHDITIPATGGKNIPVGLVSASVGNRGGSVNRLNNCASRPSTSVGAAPPHRPRAPAATASDTVTPAHETNARVSVTLT
jgi:hypothetical protein